MDQSLDRLLGRRDFFAIDRRRSSLSRDPSAQRQQPQPHFEKTFLKLLQQLKPASCVCFASFLRRRLHFLSLCLSWHFDMPKIVSPPSEASEFLAPSVYPCR